MHKQLIDLEGLNQLNLDGNEVGALELQGGQPLTDRSLYSCSDPDVSSWTRVALRESEDGSGGREEVWQFEEDAYTAGLTGLLDHRVNGGWKHVLFTLATPALQAVIYMRLMRTLFDEAPHDKSVWVEIVCCVLAFVQLANEILEGMHKVTFGLRCFSGLYVNVCRPSMLLGVLLGFFQQMVGIVTFVLCTKLVIVAQNELEAIMNFVALSFISEIDNLMLSSRMFRTCFATNEDGLRSFFRSELKVRLACQDWCRNGQMMCSRHTIAVVNVVVVFSVAFCAPISYAASGSRHPLSWDDMLRMVPGAAAVQLVLALALWFGSQQVGVAKMARLLTAGCFATYYCNAGFKIYRGAEGCFGLSPMQANTLLAFALVLVPASFANVLEPFQDFVYLPGLVVGIMLAMLLWLKDVQVSGCA